MTPSQLESVRAARLQLIDLGDESTAKLLDWVVTEEPDDWQPIATAPKEEDHPLPPTGHTMELKDLIGEHILDAVDMRQAAVTNWGGEQSMANAIAFRLDGIAYVAMEDENDGYRSAMREIVVTDEPMKNVFLPLPVVGRHRTEGAYSGKDDVLELIDTKTGQIVLEVGTDNVDDYYPGFVASFHPERMAHNTTNQGNP